MERDAGGLTPAAEAVIPLMQTVFLAKDIIGVKDIESVEAHVNAESMSRHVDSFWLNGNYEIAFDYYGIEGEGLYKNRIKLPLKAELPKGWQEGNEENLNIKVINPQVQVLAPYVLEFSGEIMVSGQKPIAVGAPINGGPQNQDPSQGFPLPEISQIQIETKNEVYIETRPDLVPPSAALDKNLELERFEFRQETSFESNIAKNMVSENPGPSHQDIGQVVGIMPYDPSTEIGEAVESKVRDLGFEPQDVEVVDMRSLKANAMKKIQVDTAKDQGIAVLMQVKPQGQTVAVDNTQTKADILAKARAKAEEQAQEVEGQDQKEVIAKVEAVSAGEIAVEAELEPNALAEELAEAVVKADETGDMAVSVESELEDQAPEEAVEVSATPQVLAAKINMLNTDIMGETLRKRSVGGTYTMTFSFAPKVEEAIAPAN